MNIKIVGIEPEVMPQEAVNAGLSSFRCSQCNTHILKRDESRSAIHLDVPMVYCLTCGDVTGVMTVRPDSSPLMDDAVARETVWYHATYVEDWFTKVTSGEGMQAEDGDFLYIHMGNEEAARDIAFQKYFEYPRFIDEKIMMYRLKIKSGAKLSPLLLSDNETWRDFASVTETTQTSLRADAVRYLNRWEAPGSISMLLDARYIEFLSVEQIYAPPKKEYSYA